MFSGLATTMILVFFVVYFFPSPLNVRGGRKYSPGLVGGRRYIKIDFELFLSPPEMDIEEDICGPPADRKSTRLNSSHVKMSYAVFCLKKKMRSMLCQS